MGAVIFPRRQAGDCSSRTWKSITEYLEEAEGEEISRIEEQLSSIEQELENLYNLRNKITVDLREKIRKQSDRLSRAEEASKPDEEMVHDRLADLSRI